MNRPPVIVLATANPGKAREFARLLGGAVEVRPLPPSVSLPEETGRTFAENARLKATWAHRALGGEQAVLADDSGLEVAALDGRPGLLSARFAGPVATDDQNVAKLLGELQGKGDRRARFVCRLCLVLRNGSLIEEVGVTNGIITESPRGVDGFGYDPVFVPEGWTCTLAEAPPEQKDQVSHRGAAARALLHELQLRGVLDSGL